MELPSPMPVNRLSSSSVLESTLQVKQSLGQTRSHLIWGFFNIALTSALAYNLVHLTVDGSLKTQSLYYGQLFLVAVFGINSFFHLARYSYISFTLEPVCLSPSQRKLLGIARSDRYFKPPAATPKTPTTPREEPQFTATYPMNLSANSLLSPGALNENLDWRKRCLSRIPSPPNAPRPLFEFLNVPMLPSTSPNQSTYSPRTRSLWSPHLSIPSSPVSDPIRDEASLSRFLDSFAEQEKFASFNMSGESSQTSLGSFWNSPTSRSSAANEVSPLLRRCAYQLAPVVTVAPSPGSPPEEGGSPASSTMSNSEFWRRLKVDPNRLTQWNANLRMWISLTILQRVVAELDHIDAAFVRCGLSDLHLGSVGLDRLKRTATIPQVVASIPSLPRLVPFLELSQHQEYLVTRIRELAKGGSMSEFHWNSGGSLHGKAWEEHLPTDSALVMHLIATYLDLQLIPTAQRTDGPLSRPFSSQHLVRSPERPPARPHAPVIHQTHLNPPNFVVHDKDEVFDVPKGRNNVFHAFLLFLHLLKTREHGMLGPVNLGRSGVNVLWVVDS